jgi:hypothetical protein
VDRPATLDRLDQQLKALLESSRAKRALEAKREAAKQAADAEIIKASSPSASSDAPKSISVDPISKQPQGEAHAKEQYARNAATQAAGNESLQITFIETDLAHFATTVNADAFFEMSYEPVLVEMITLIVATEGPVLDAMLARRISRAHGWQRTGSRIIERVEEVARRCCRTSEEEVGTFYWPETIIPGSAVFWRPPANEQQRAIDEVCAEELRSLAALVFDPAKGDEWTLVQMARQLGLMKLRAASRPRLEAAIRAATA